MEGAQLERGCEIAPNSTVPAGTRIPENTLWAGNPVRFVKNLESVQNRIAENQSNPTFKITQQWFNKIISFPFINLNILTKYDHFLSK